MRRLIKDKKAEGDEGLFSEALVKTILFCAIVLAVVIPAMFMIYEFYYNRADTAMLKQMDTLQQQINSIGNNDREFPIYLKAPFTISVFSNDKLCGSDKSCACLCPKGECDNPKYDKTCKTFETKIKNNCIINPYFGIDISTGKPSKVPTPQNCIIKKEASTENSKEISVITISGCCT